MFTIEPTRDCLSHHNMLSVFTLHAVGTQNRSVVAVCVLGD